MSRFALFVIVMPILVTSSKVLAGNYPHGAAFARNAQNKSLVIYNSGKTLRYCVKFGRGQACTLYRKKAYNKPMQPYPGLCSFKAVTPRSVSVYCKAGKKGCGGGSGLLSYMSARQNLTGNETTLISTSGAQWQIIPNPNHCITIANSTAVASKAPTKKTTAPAAQPPKNTDYISNFKYNVLGKAILMKDARKNKVKRCVQFTGTTFDRCVTYEVNYKGEIQKVPGKCWIKGSRTGKYLDLYCAQPGGAACTRAGRKTKRLANLFCKNRLSGKERTFTSGSKTWEIVDARQCDSL